jgi:nitrite reductase (NADH) small subunit
MAMPLFAVTTIDLLTPGTLAHVEAGGRAVAICNHEGTIHAFDGHCPHRGAPLGQGNLFEGHIICPWHAWAFNCLTGEFDFNPAIRIERYPVTVKDGQVFVEVPE